MAFSILDTESWDRETKQRFDASQGIGARVSTAARERGLIARAMPPHGNILGFAPPLVATREEIDRIVEIARAAVDDMLPQ